MINALPKSRNTRKRRTLGLAADTGDAGRQTIETGQPRDTERPVAAPHSILLTPSPSTSNSNPGDIDLSAMIPFSAVPKVLPRSTRSGKRMAPATVHRWHQDGLNGIKLKALKIGA